MILELADIRIHPGTGPALGARRGSETPRHDLLALPQS